VVRDGLLAEIERLGGRNPILSTNIPLRRDGLPYAARRVPEDPGVAVYFDLDGEPQCFPCDKWDRVQDNLRAIELTIRALRGLERWGAKEMVRAAFRGFQALPPPGGDRPWWKVLGVRQEAPIDVIEAAYRLEARQAHPDINGGAADRMVELNRAIEEARRTRA
jgi:hypothetical protein